MTTNDVFNSLSTHMIKGMMIHEQLANYYQFLGLHGYKRCHDYHFIHESKCFRKLNRYFIDHQYALIKENSIEDPKIIPDSWFQHETTDLDENDITEGVKSGIQKWVMWEKETKLLYSNMYLELVRNGCVSGAEFVSKHLLKDVDHELKKASREWIKLTSANFDILFILGEQKSIHDKYKKKMKR